MSLRVLRMAAGASFQDGGRPGWRRFGVPPGGAFDRESYALSLALAVSSSETAIELTPPGAEFEVIEEDRLALVGAPFQVLLNGQPIGYDVAFSVRPGDRLQLSPSASGLCAYLASQRGWLTDALLGSTSGQPIPEVMSVSEPASNGNSASSRLAKPPTSRADRPLRVLPGPQTLPGDLEALAIGDFQASLQSNRVGIRFSGARFEARAEIVSEPSLIGAVQLTPSGELIIHGPDGPTIGGYPKIAVVIEADLDRLGQLAPMQKVRFDVVDSDQATAADRLAQSSLRKRLAELRASQA